MALHTKQKQQLQQGVKLQLTPREIEIATAYAKLGTSRYVAKHLHLSIKGVQAHIEGITKKLEAKTIVEAIALILDDLEITISEPPLCELTRKELQVLNLLKTGKCNSEIALSTDMKIRSIEVHVNSILKKTNLKNRCRLLTYSRIYPHKFVYIDHSKKAKIIQLKASGLSAEAIAQRLQTTKDYIWQCKDAGKESVQSR